MIKAFNRSQLKLIKPHGAYTGETPVYTTHKVKAFADNLMFQYPRQVAYRMANKSVGKKKRGLLEVDDYVDENFTDNNVKKDYSVHFKTLADTHSQLKDINDLVKSYMAKGFTHRQSLSLAKKEAKSKK